MVKKLKKMSADRKTSPQFSNAVKESAQQIWLAGLGAFSKAQAEGGKVFDTLVKEGVGIQRKTQSAAEEKISAATTKMTSMANDISSKAGHQWDKLETIFEDRVAKALSKLGVPSAKEVADLAKRVEELNKTMQKTGGKSATTSSRSASKSSAQAAKPATKPVTKPATKRAAKTPVKKAAAKRTVR